MVDILCIELFDKIEQLFLSRDVVDRGNLGGPVQFIFRPDRTVATFSFSRREF